MKTALITGIYGQDGGYLAQYLLARGYKITGISDIFFPHRSEISVTPGPRVEVLIGDICDKKFIGKVFQDHHFDEIYHLAAQSHVGRSFLEADMTERVNLHGSIILHQAFARQKAGKFYQASSSEMFGNQPTHSLHECSPMAPVSPYGRSKFLAHQSAINLRKELGLHITNGILFNHESPNRGAEFVTQKIVKGLCALVRGSSRPLILGNLDAKRDWGDARDYVEGMWRMLQQETPSDYVLATGTCYSVREVFQTVATLLGLDVMLKGEGMEERAVLKRTNLPHLKRGQIIMSVSKEHFRPRELHTLRGNATRARHQLGWSPRHTFTRTLNDMIDAEMYRSGIKTFLHAV